MFATFETDTGICRCYGSEQDCRDCENDDPENRYVEEITDEDEFFKNFTD